MLPTRLREAVAIALATTASAAYTCSVVILYAAIVYVLTRS